MRKQLKSLLLSSIYDRYGVYIKNMGEYKKYTRSMGDFDFDSFRCDYMKYWEGVFPCGFGSSLITPQGEAVAICVDFSAKYEKRGMGNIDKIQKLESFLKGKGIKYGIFKLRPDYSKQVWIGFSNPMPISQTFYEKNSIKVYPDVGSDGRSSCNFVSFLGVSHGDWVSYVDDTPISLDLYWIDECYLSLENNNIDSCNGLIAEIQSLLEIKSVEGKILWK